MSSNQLSDFVSFEQVNDSTFNSIDQEQLYQEVQLFRPDNKVLSTIKAILKDYDIELWRMDKSDATDKQVLSALRQSVVAIRKLDIIAKYIDEENIDKINADIKKMLKRDFSGKKVIKKEVPKCLKRKEVTKPKKDD